MVWYLQSPIVYKFYAVEVILSLWILHTRQINYLSFYTT